MKKRTIAFRIMIIVLGAAALLGFFLFPVLKNKLVEALGGLAGAVGGTEDLSLTGFRMVTDAFAGDEALSGVAMLGYTNPALCGIQFLVPAICALCMIIFGCIGKKAGGIGTICSGAISLIFYILQIVLFPGSKNSLEAAAGLTYQFSFWQWILIGIVAVAIVMGILEVSSTVRYNAEFGDDGGQSYYPGEDPGSMMADQGTLIGIQGEYNGATIPVRDGVRILIGRNPNNCNLVINDPQVSRLHCYVSYHADRSVYTVMDVSTYGVFDGQGNAIEKNVDVFMEHGDQIRLGKSQNIFRLG